MVTPPSILPPLSLFRNDRGVYFDFRKGGPKKATGGSTLEKKATGGSFVKSSQNPACSGPPCRFSRESLSKAAKLILRIPSFLKATGAPRLGAPVAFPGTFQENNRGIHIVSFFGKHFRNAWIPRFQFLRKIPCRFSFWGGDEKQQGGSFVKYDTGWKTTARGYPPAVRRFF